MKVHIYLWEILIGLGMNLRFAASIPYKLWFCHGCIVFDTNSWGWWQWMEELGQGLSFWALRKVLGLSAHDAIVSFSSRFVVVLKNDLTTCCERHACLFSWGCVGRKSVPSMFERKVNSLFLLLLSFQKGKTSLQSWIQIQKGRLRREFSFLPLHLLVTIPYQYSWTLNVYFRKNSINFLLISNPFHK